MNSPRLSYVSKPNSVNVSTFVEELGAQNTKIDKAYVFSEFMFPFLNHVLNTGVCFGSTYSPEVLQDLLYTLSLSSSPALILELQTWRLQQKSSKTQSRRLMDQSTSLLRRCLNSWPLKRLEIGRLCLMPEQKRYRCVTFWKDRIGAKRSCCWRVLSCNFISTSKKQYWHRNLLSLNEVPVRSKMISKIGKIDWPEFRRRARIDRGEISVDDRGRSLRKSYRTVGVSHCYWRKEKFVRGFIHERTSRVHCSWTQMILTLISVWIIVIL